MAPIHPLDTPSRWRRTEPLAGDASTRTYSRLEDRGGHTWILADYPAEARHALPRDLEVLGWMRTRGLRVPEIVDHDAAGGWMLLEDLGSADAEQTLRMVDPLDRPRLFDATLSPLVALARIDPDELPDWNQPLDRGRLRWELCGFELWFVADRTGRPPSPELTAWLDALAEEVSGHPQRVCHRDYHLNNLYFLEGGEVGMIDVQDVLVGPDTYDAVSLIAERSAPELIGEGDRRRWIEGWAKHTGATPGWQGRMDTVRVQRALKVLGTFGRLVAAGDSRYRPWLDALVRQLAAEGDRLRLHPHVTELLVD
jgi:hypothetical protein